MHKSILSFLFIILCCVSSAFAQGGTGQLSGNVVDANGAAVAGANVKLTSLVTSQDREATTNDSGDFVFTLLPAGAYKLEITATGFRTVVVDEVKINVTQTTTLPIRLDAATVSGMVTITAESPLVQQ
ncbi:MAG TPA: carboxypeptidase-like regulatory domain-containing protein, partial [Pyrinomonadaceae bacterium]